MTEPTDELAWLTADSWATVNRNLVAKTLTEFTYEGIIDPEITEDGQLTCTLEGGVLTGRARYRVLGWWRVEPASLRWTPRHPAPAPDPDGALPAATDLLAAMLTAHGVTADRVAALVSEISATLVSDAWQDACGRPSPALLDLPQSDIDSQLRGHPWIVANKGRIGFGVDDMLAYAPESGRTVRLLWLAAAPDMADMRGLDHHDVVREQVGDEEFARLQENAAQGGLDPDSCVYLPVHPWQWTNRIVPLHAGELANGALVPLGQGSARYQPQLAIRTLTDADHPHRRYLKLPLSILNTSVYRGLPRERALAAPALTDWLAGLAHTDEFLQETGVVLLGEVASVSVAHPTYEALPGVPYQHTEMLGAIWREPVDQHLQPGEQAMSLAALLHVDASGDPLVRTMVERSGQDPRGWLEHLHRAVLPPLLHILYRYGAMFSPHGQNCLLIHRDGVPTRLVVKDFVDDLALSAEPLPEHAGLTPQVHSALADVTIPPSSLVKYLHNGLMIGVYRYLAEIADDALGIDEFTFWSAVRAEVGRYQDRFRELKDRFDQFDLQRPHIPKLCLNRLRLFERGYADDPERPVISAAGEIWNPLGDAPPPPLARLS